MDQIDPTLPFNTDIKPVRLQGHSDAVLDASFSPDSQWLATASSDQTVRLWNMNEPNVNEHALILKQAGKTSGVSFSPDSQWLATVKDAKNIYLWNLTGSNPESEKIELTGGGENLSDSVMVFGPNGEWFAVGTFTGPIYVWRLPAQHQSEPFLKLIGHKDEVTRIRFLGDELISSSADSTIRVWKLNESSQNSDSITLQYHTGEVFTIELSKDNHWLASTSTDRTARLWDVSSIVSGEYPEILTGHNSFVTDAAFSYDSQKLVTVSENQIILWNLGASNLQNSSVNLHGGDFVRYVNFSPDDQWIVSSSQYADIISWTGEMNNFVSITKLWQNNLDDLLVLACEVSGRNLSYSEWQKYFPEENYRLTCPENPAHPSFKTVADQLIMGGDIEAGKLLLEHVKNIDSNFDVDIEKEIQEFTVFKLLREARDLAQRGYDQEATIKLEEAQKLAPSLFDDGTSENLAEISEKAIFQQISYYVEQENFELAIRYLADTQKNRNFTNWDYMSLWSHMCEQGIYSNQVERVIKACDNAYFLDPENVVVRKYRGVVRALSGDESGAIEDFEYFVEWVDGSEVNVIKKWISALEAGVDPFDKKTLTALEDGNLSGTRNPLNIETFNIGDEWTIDVVDFPDNLMVEFPAFLQCREDKNSEQFTEEFVGFLAVRPLRQNAWVDRGHARFLLESSSGEIVGGDFINFSIGSTETDWIFPDNNIQGHTVSSTGSEVRKLKIVFDYASWRPTTDDVSEYPIDVIVSNHQFYGNNQYPQSKFNIVVNNLGLNTLEGVHLFGGLINQEGELVDIIKMGNSNELSIAPKSSVEFEVMSFSETGRCVGAKPFKSTFHYWISFMTDGGQVITRYFSVDVP